MRAIEKDKLSDIIELLDHVIVLSEGKLKKHSNERRVIELSLTTANSREDRYYNQGILKISRTIRSYLINLWKHG